MDPEQTDLGPHCLSYRLLKHFSRLEKQTTFVGIGALRVKTSLPASDSDDIPERNFQKKVKFYKKSADNNESGKDFPACKALTLCLLGNFSCIFVVC